MKLFMPLKFKEAKRVRYKKAKKNCKKSVIAH